MFPLGRARNFYGIFSHVEIFTAEAQKRGENQGEAMSFSTKSLRLCVSAPLR